MNKINSTEEALKIFEQAIIERAKAQQAKESNKMFDLSRRAIKYLKKNHSLLELKRFFTSPHIATKCSAAIILLPIAEKECIAVLQEVAISSTDSFIRFEAKRALEEWTKSDSEARKFLINQCK